MTILLLIGISILIYLIYSQRFKVFIKPPQNPNAERDLKEFINELSSVRVLDPDTLTILLPLFDFIKSADYPYYKKLYDNSLKIINDKEVKISDEKNETTPSSLLELLKTLNFDIKRVEYVKQTPNTYFFLDNSNKFIDNGKLGYVVLKSLF